MYSQDEQEDDNRIYACTPAMLAQPNPRGKIWFLPGQICPRLEAKCLGTSRQTEILPPPRIDLKSGYLNFPCDKKKEYVGLAEVGRLFY